MQGDKEINCGGKGKEREIPGDLRIKARCIVSDFQVADSETIRLPTLKELIGYPTTYHDDRTTTTSSSVLLHLLRNDVDNDISRQNVEESLKGAETQHGERVLAQSSRGSSEEIHSWLQQASENKAKSRAMRIEDTVNLDERVSVTNAIQGGENKRKLSTTAIYLKPTTMRGIPLVSLIPSSVVRGFYITRSENDLSSSILTDSSTPSYTTIDTPVEQQTETTLISDTSMINEAVTVAHNNQIESKVAFNENVNDIVNDKGVDSTEKYSTTSSSVIFSKEPDNIEILSNHEKSDSITISIDIPVSKRGKSLRDFDHTTPLPNFYVASSTTPTRRRIALAVSKYSEATTPLWTGRRIVAKKRIRTTASPIKDAIRQIESDSIRALTSSSRNASPLTRSASALISRRLRPPTTITIPTISSVMPDSTEILNVYNNHANSYNTKTEEPENHATVEIAETLINSETAATSPISKVISTANDLATDISTFSNDPTTMTVPAIANASITIAPPIVAVAKAAPAVTTDATITTASAITDIGVEPTSSNYSVIDTPTIENTDHQTDAIPTDSATTIAFAEDTKSEITSTSVNTVPEFAQITATDPVTRPTIESIEIEGTSTMTDYSAITIPDTTNAQEIATDLENTIRTQITNADIGATSTISNYSTDTIPTTINMHDDTTDATSITAANAEAEIETTSMIENNFAFTTTVVKNTTTIPVTTSPVTTTASPLTMAISSTVNTQHMHATAPMTTSDLADANIVTTNTITTTTPFSTIIPTITDLNVIRTSVNANIPSTFAIDETTPITIQSKTTISSKTPITSAVVTSTNSAAPPSSTIEFSTIHFTDPNNLEFTRNSEVTATPESTAETTEIPTTFEIPPTFTSTATAFSKSLDSTNFETSSIESTIALSTQEDNSLLTSKVTQTPSSLSSIATLIINKATVPLERSTASATLSALDESITINPTIQTTTNGYDSVQTISEKSIMSEQKTDFKKVMPIETQSQTSQMINEKSTTPEIKIVSEETTLKTIQNRKQNQSSELDTTNYYFNQKTARRRVVNRTNNWLGSASPTLQRTSQYPRHRVAVYRGRPRRPSTDTSSSRVVEKNRRRRVMQKRVRVNSEPFNSTVTPDSANIQNTTDHVAYDRIENGRRMKVVLKKIKEKVDEKPTIILPIEETTMFLQASTAIENKMLQVHPENKNIEEKQKIIPEKIEQSQESFTTEKTSINSSNESLPDNSQSNLHVAEDLSQKPRKIMKVLKNVRPQSEEKNPIEEASANSINTNPQDNFTKTPYPSKNLSDKRTARRRMRIVLKNIKPKSEEKNSTIEEINVASNSIDKSFQNNLSNNVNVSQNFSNEEKPRRRTRVILKRVKSNNKSEEEGTKTEANTEHDSTNESLQGTFSNNFYSAKNFPIQYEIRRRMRVVLKNVKPKSEEKNSTVEETTADSNSTNENLQSTFLNNFRDDKNFSVEYGNRRRMRVILKRVNPKSKEKNSTVEKTTDPDSNNTNFQGTFLNNSRRGKNLPVEYRTKRRRVVLKSIKPKSEDRNLTTEETSIDSTDLQGSFSSNLYINENLSNEEEARRRTEIVLKNVKPKKRDSVVEETSTDSDFARKDPQVLYTFHFSSNLQVGDNLPDKKKKHSKSEEKEAMIERQEDTKTLQTTRTSVPVEKDTDRPSLEVKHTGSISRNPGSGQSNRHRKPSPFTTSAPLTNTLSNTLTTHRRGRPVETTLSPRIDFVDTLEDTESYVKPATLHDQNADVSDQSIRAQEYAVTLSDPPSSSSDIGRTLLRDADRRKISTTIAPRTDSTTSRTVSRYDVSLRSRQRPRAKDRPTVNATTRPRRPPIVDYDYYEDETPIIVADRSVLNSKLFLTSKGTVRCLDQGNFPHPYSCKKFITCARMVNGQVIGTEYSCPDKLSFDPIGGICNWSAGLGCKD